MKNLKHYAIAVVAAVLFSACGTTRTVPLTGRKQNLMISDQEVLSLSSQEYTKYMQGAKKSADATNTAGKIVVYEGLLPVTQNEASLAIVLGHEIAHAVANHSAEQMSKQIKQQYGLQIGSAVAGALGMGTNTQSIAQVIAQYGLQFRNLKYSRDHETEADRMGLIFAAMAGYDPNVAVSFWQRMAASTGSASAEFLSDHPSDATRINNIQTKFLPEALKYYKPPVQTTTTTTAKKASSTKSTGTRKVSTTKKSTTKKR